MSIIDVSPSFADNARLHWLKRATAQDGLGDQEPVHLDPVGGRIVAETHIDLVYGDGHSYLMQDPNWNPTSADDRSKWEI
ncbi:hypothetical protein QO004_001047 [Rhizobium mesoamericanum]|uniref:hypothetical protein n=1 Tax=Rhizobium mesoamericanum TaxID=1079800 RepID=UPI0027800F59|nr:hypothetical protein [Rhizobium mesoamericanum]MDQ0559269.1 hypothetical protein [Rhizobium mesoamericanum]